MAKYIHETIYITESQTWRAPKTENQAFEVTIYGAGGSGSLDSFDGVLSGAGGGSGFKATANLTIPENEEVEIIIGDGGKGKSGITATELSGRGIGKTGGTTFFGKYLYAVGGLGGYLGTGGDGYYDGGNSGEDGEGGVGSDGLNDTINGKEYQSGGGGSAPDSIGRGGSANTASGDAGAAGGGAGAMYVELPSGKLEKHIGSGGPGFCIISYNKEI